MRARRWILLTVIMVGAVAWSIEGVGAKSREAELLKNADRIAARVAVLRGLPIKRKIGRGVMNRAQIKKRLIERIEQEYSSKEIAAEELAFKRLGLLEPEADYLDLVIDLMTDQVAGFYDPWERQLYLADWSMFGADMLMAHEIDHALQDQHFDLQRLMKRARDNNDALIARQALVEGDGTALMLEFSMDKLGRTVPWGQAGFVDRVGSSVTMAMASFGEAPLVLREGLIFPYLGGLRFVAYFRKHHSWRRIDHIYQKLPLSTEHVLHPAKYERYERPDLVAEEKPPTLSSYRKVYDNVSGELGLSIFLQHHRVEARRAARAAAGWGGDRLVLYAPPGHDGDVSGTLAVHYSTWDAEPDAIEFFEALREALSSATGGPEVKSRRELIEYRTSRGAVAYAERQADAVLMVLGAPPARADEVRSQIWSRFSVTRR